ncbi:ABC transporter permease, partial [Lacticaseibacillus paracasei]
MWKTILRRVLIMIPQLILLSVLVFMLSKMMPGDQLTGNFSQGQSAAQMAALRQQYGLNDPWYIQYFKWVGNMFHGDLGQSFVYKRSVTGLIGERAVNTFWLALMSTVILYVIAIPAGVIAGRYEGT